MPNGFRTDFRPRVIDNADISGSRHRAMTAEYRALDPAPVPSSNFDLQYMPKARTYRLNRGTPIVGDTGATTYGGFGADWTFQQVAFNTRLNAQLISNDLLPMTGFMPDGAAQPIRQVWLAAPKTTEALFLAMNRTVSGLRLWRVSGSAQVTSVRASALSATMPAGSPGGARSRYRSRGVRRSGA